MKTLLVLEDEPLVMKLLRHMLKEYVLVEATSAEQAIQLFHDRDRKIDLLVADVTLPTSSGIQVALLFRLELPELPVILTSGYPVGGWSDRDAADLQRLGFHLVVVLQKPISHKKLSNEVCELIGPVQPDKARTSEP